MKKKFNFHSRFLLLVPLMAVIGFSGCIDTPIEIPDQEKENPITKLDIGLDELLSHASVTTSITSRSHGYFAEAKGKGIIPGGEYAGYHFQITMEGFYTGVAPNTLDNGTVTVKIRSERFVSVVDPLLQSFCCGEGDLILIDGEWIFSMYGQVVHTTASEIHNHLFAGLARSSGTMNMNIADQTGTVVIPAMPPHDPGIGLIEEFNAQRVEVTEH